MQDPLECWIMVLTFSFKSEQIEVDTDTWYPETLYINENKTDPLLCFYHWFIDQKPAAKQSTRFHSVTQSYEIST